MRAGVSPTSRALRALELLQLHPGVTADQLAAQLGVTGRAARRYVALLREAGIPVAATRGPYGGYRLGRGVRLPPLVFSTTEALALVMAVLDGNHSAADDRDPVGAALDKLLRALPDGVSDPAATVRRHAATVPDRRAAHPDPQTASALAAAAAGRRRVRIDYRSQSGTRWAETVDPWAVVVRHGLWYLLCHSHRAGEIRAYRIDRIQSVRPTDDQFPAPAGVDYVQLLEQHLGAGREFQTRVLFGAPPAHVAPHIRPPMGRLEPVDHGARCLLIGTTSNPHMYASEWLAPIPIAYHVQGGPELRAAVTDLAQRLTAALRAPLAQPAV